MNFFDSCRHSTRLSLIVLDALTRHGPPPDERDAPRPREVDERTPTRPTPPSADRADFICVPVGPLWAIG